MFIRKIGQRFPTFEGEDLGGGGGAHPVEAPWTGAEGVWNVGEGDAAKPWHAAIPEAEARQHVEAKGYANPAELALANYNLTKLHRGDPTVIGLPGKDATPEDMSAFYGKLGRPDAPEGYEFKFAEGVKVDDAMMGFARSTFHEAGLTPAQAQLVGDKWNEFAAQQNDGFQQQTTEQNDAAIAALETKWGDAGDLEKNKAAGKRVVEGLGLSAELIGAVEQNIGSAAIVELLATIGRKSDEGGLVNPPAVDPNNPETMTKEQASAKIAELNGDPEFQKKFTDNQHPGHKDALSLMERLYSRV